MTILLVLVASLLSLPGAVPLGTLCSPFRTKTGGPIASRGAKAGALRSRGLRKREILRCGPDVSRGARGLRYSLLRHYCSDLGSLMNTSEGVFSTITTCNFHSLKRAQIIMRNCLALDAEPSEQPFMSQWWSM